ncbi:probable F-box protein At1g44080 [Lycium barbarum]|uniref:probable F-box protein At1g44080 n=1 Tax=Lycium barbarum TaxID=112863 RepID=UPI00293E4437|nr:probable F-box protein At1g44080 [Lycium barbarum]
MDGKSRSGDWALLSDWALDLIFRKLPSISDCLCFSLVCKPWFSFVSNNYDVLQQRINSSSIEELPLLINFTDEDICFAAYPLNRCVGSSHGWLAFQQRGFDSFFLFNPFSGETINLPNLKIYTDKVTLSKNPSTNPHDFEVAALCKNLDRGESLAILKPGNKTWFRISFRGRRPCDVIYYNERYYVVFTEGSIFSIDNTDNPTVRHEIAPPPSMYTVLEFYLQFYLVKTTTNELLRVERSPPSPSSSVKICKLVTSPKTQTSMFVDVDNLGDEALFVCHNGSTSVSASKFPGCKPNSIYYMDRSYTQSRFDNFHYSVDHINLQDRSSHTQFSFFQKFNIAPRALWIIPTPKVTTTS